MDANVTFVHKQTKCYIGEDEIVTSDHMHRHLVKRDEQQEVCSGDTCRNGIVKMEDEIIPADHKRRILIQRDGFPAQDPQVVSLKEIIKQQVELAIGDISKDVVKSISILIGSGSVPFSCDTLSKVSVKVGIGEEHSVFIQNEGERLLLAVPVSDNIEMVCSSGIQIPMELIVTDGSYKMYASKYGLQKGMLNYTID